MEHLRTRIKIKLKSYKTINSIKSIIKITIQHIWKNISESVIKNEINVVNNRYEYILNLFYVKE